MGIKVNLKNVRVGYLNAFEKSKDSTNAEGKLVKGKRQVTVYLAPDDTQIQKLEDAAFEVVAAGMKSESAAEKWIKKNFGFGNHADKCCVRDLAERDKVVEGLEEGLYFKASSHKKVRIMTSIGEMQCDPTQRDEPVRGLTVDGDDIEGQEVYSGCYANVSVELYWYADYKCLLASFLGIRFKADGQAFGGAGEYADEDDLSDGDDEPRGKKSRRSRDEDDEPRKPRRSRDEDDEDDEDEEEDRRSRRRR